MLKKLGQNGIGIAVNYRAIHLLKYFKEKFGYKRGDFPIAENIGDSTISLPFYLKLQEREFLFIISKLKSIL